MFNELRANEEMDGIKRNVYMGLISVYMEGAFEALRLALALHGLTSGLYGALIDWG